MTAMEDLDALLAPLPGFSLLTPGMKQKALDVSLVPDSSGVWPGQAGYVTTYDVYWAALGLLGYLEAQPVVRQSSSEGTSVAVDAPNWAGLRVYYRSLSQVASATGGDGLGVLLIPGGPHVVRTDMSGVGDGNGDVDTDVA